MQPSSLRTVASGERGSRRNDAPQQLTLTDARCVVPSSQDGLPMDFKLENTGPARLIARLILLGS